MEITGISNLGRVGGATWATPTTDGATAAGGTGAAGFAKALDGLQAMQTKADDLSIQAATGDLTDVHDYTIAATQAQVATDLTVAIRNKAVSAFTEIMRMPL